MVKAIYAFSGDPITYGHIDIIKRATGEFDKLIAGIGANPDKKYMFSLEERTEMARRSLIGLSNVSVVSFKGLLAYYAYENNIPFIIRGIRNSEDALNEENFARVNKQLVGVETKFFKANPQLAHISSSAVKAIQKENGMVHEYVPLYVKQCLEARISGQYIVCITGEIGAGKSYVGRKFEEFGRERSIQVHNIELDNIGHDILSELKEPLYQKVREEIASTFGQEVRLSDGRINRRTLGEVVFNDKAQLKRLNEIMYMPLVIRLNREMFDKKGLILFNAAIIAESEMTYLCNNNTILINVDKKSQERRLLDRNLSLEQIKTRLNSQHNYEEKKNKITEAINRDNQGKLWVLNNSDNSNSSEIKDVFEEVVKALGVK